MRLKSLIFIVLALGMAGLTAVLVNNWIQSQRAAMEAAMANAKRPKPTLQILVAKQDLSVGQFVRPEHLRWQAWPEGSLAPNYVVEGKRPLEDFVGGVVRQPIANGEPVTEGRVVSPGNSGFMAAVLQPGFRAVSVPVNVTSGISGFIFPGDRVDLILTHAVVQDPDEKAGNAERHASVTTLRDIRVLALDQKIDMKPGETAVARTATLEVTPKQVEMIAVLVEMGKLSLSLRSLARGEGEIEDAAAPEKSYTFDSELSGILPPIAFIGSTRRVVLMRGNKTDELKLPAVSR